MQIDDIELLKIQFHAYWLSSVQELTHRRATKMSQEKWARLVGKSVKTIQRFENYKSHNPELMFLYKKTFK